MTIDETIARAREKAKDKRETPVSTIQEEIDCMKCARENEQLAEWLEELKAYQDKNKMVVRIDVDSIKDKIEELSKYAESQYDKAIDNIKEKLMQNGFIYTQHALDVFNEIAEQLKAGGNIELPEYSNSKGNRTGK